MDMTHKEQVLRTYLIRLLKSQGYLTYAKILRFFDVFIERPGDTRIAFLDYGEKAFFINPTLGADFASVIIRHEIMHLYLKHETRLINLLAKEMGFDPDNLTEESLDQINYIIFNDKMFDIGPDGGVVYGNKSNLAGDYEISNKMYTKKDKELIRKLYVNGQLTSGLITEDMHPGWEDMSLEELYTELDKICKDDKKKYQDNSAVIGNLENPTTFVGADGTVYGID